MDSLVQGCQTHFHQGPHQPRSCLQGAKCTLILGLCKRNYSLTRGKELYIWPFESNPQADVPPRPMKMSLTALV